MHVSGIAVGNPSENETFIKDGKDSGKNNRGCT